MLQSQPTSRCLRLHVVCIDVVSGLYAAGPSRKGRLVMLHVCERGTLCSTVCRRCRRLCAAASCKSMGSSGGEQARVRGGAWVALYS